jgi:hypothetical protein
MMKKAGMIDFVLKFSLNGTTLMRFSLTGKKGKILVRYRLFFTSAGA